MTAKSKVKRDKGEKGDREGRCNRTVKCIEDDIYTRAISLTIEVRCFGYSADVFRGEYSVGTRGLGQC